VSAPRADSLLNAQLADIVRSSGDAIIGTTDNGRIVTWNPGAERIYGHGANEVVGQSMSILVSPEKSDRLTSMLRGVARGERIEHYETVHVRKDGSRVDISLTVSPVKDVEGALMGASTIARDITARKRVQQNFEQFIELAPDAIVGVSENGKIALLNAQAEQIFGYERDELYGKPLETVVPERSRGIHAVHRSGYFKHPRTRPMGAGLELHGLRKDGSEFPAEISLSSIETEDGVVAIAAIRDVTADRALSDARAHLKAAFDHAPIGTALVSIRADSYARFLSVNQALCALTGYSHEQLQTMTFQSLTHPDDIAEGRELMRQLLAHEVPSYQLEKRLIHADRKVSWVMLNASLVSDDSGTPLYCIHQLQDIEERKRFEVQLAHLADHDPLTGLFNRRRFGHELSRELSSAGRYGGSGAVLIIDIDNFKHINDTLGHNAGDEVMMEVAHLLRERLRDTDILARLGGDEFGVLLPHAAADDAEALAHGLLGAVRRGSIAVGGERPTRLTTSIGMAFFGTDSKTTPEDLLIDADVAMYDAKQQGRDRFAFASHEQRQRMAARQTWTQRIRQALEDDLFVLYCQPILDLQTNRISQHELLLRMPGDHDELILPAAFIDTAERFGLIRAIDRWVLGRAIRLLAEHKRGRNLRLEVNISGSSVTDPDLPAFIEQELNTRSVDPADLILEVTETAAIANIAQARWFVAQLTDIGCGFALDDFGAGFGSFYYLKHLPFDYLKIDGEFIRNLAGSSTDQVILKSIVEMADALGKQTIAEFVGNEESVRLLREQHVDFAQGYHVARPRPLSEIWAPINADRGGGDPALATQPHGASPPAPQ
jgi:diguanylate cyclase (GGDEF)-like protein/PAS domain S-box-containing protein